MKGSPIRQRCALAEYPPSSIDAKVKHISVLIFENQGKTIVQPIVSERDAEVVRKLVKNKTMEVWLPNGKSDPAQFDISILKYQQLMQPSTVCCRNENIVCLKNHFETIVSCDQCPLGSDGASD